MPKPFVEFKAIKSSIRMEEIIAHYGLTDRFKKSGDSLSGPCPIHKGNNPTQFRISLSKNVWNCFSECKNGGNVLDFIAKMESVTIQPPEKQGPNKPLKFRLELLDRLHPYLAGRGLALETCIDFDIGFCARGMMGDRIAIPVHNPKGEVVAYAGRFPGDPAGDTPKYKFPPGFRKSQEIFNIDRAFKQPEEMPLVIVEGFFGCMNLWQLRHRKVVALMGSSMSEAQEELIRQHITTKTKIIVMLDEDEAGRAGREDIALRLSKFVFVKIQSFTVEGFQPEKLNADDLVEIFN